MLTITVSPAGRGKFTAHLQEGRQLCQRTFAPFLAAARQLLADGRDPDTQITMRHAGSNTDALMSTIGVAAKLCVTERQAAVPRFARYQSSHENECAQLRQNPPLHAFNDDWGTSGSPAAEKSLYDGERTYKSKLTCRLLQMRPSVARGDHTR
jgi:hypothetical protein